MARKPPCMRAPKAIHSSGVSPSHRLSQRPGQYSDTRNCHCSTTDLDNAAVADLSGISDCQGCPDADGVKQRGRADKADPVFETRSALRHFHAMCMAMKDCKEAHKRHSGQRRDVKLECNRQT